MTAKRVMTVAHIRTRQHRTSGRNDEKIVARHKEEVLHTWLQHWTMTANLHRQKLFRLSSLPVLAKLPFHTHKAINKPSAHQSQYHMRDSGGKVQARADPARRARRACSPAVKGRSACAISAPEGGPWLKWSFQAGSCAFRWAEKKEKRLAPVSHWKGFLRWFCQIWLTLHPKEEQFTIRTVLCRIISCSCRHAHLRDF